MNAPAQNAPAQDLRRVAERAIALHRGGDASAALPLYDQLIAAQPASVPLRVLKAQALLAIGDSKAERAVLEQAVGLDPGAVAPLVALGANAERAGDRLGAIAAFDRALAADPANVECRIRRALVLTALRRFDDAEATLSAAVREKPDNAAYWIAYGTLLIQRGKPVEAEGAYHRALALAPDSAEVHHGLATVLEAGKDIEGALAAYEKSLGIAPRDPLALSNYATLLARLGRMKEAEALFEQALAIEPRLASASNNLGSLLIKTGEVERGVALERRAAELDPDNPGFAANVLFVSHYDPSIGAEALAEAHFAWGRRYEALARPEPRFANARDPERPLKIGYMSPDFRSHSVGYSVFPVLQAHDRSRFDITLYGEIEQSDPMTERIRMVVPRWRSTIGVEDPAVLEQIRADEIDILVDLAGHTAGNRLTVFARRAAPVQVTWLGYPDSTGLTAMDYRLVDAVSDPEGVADRLASERLVRLPTGFIVATPLPGIPNVGVPPLFRNGHVTFGSFNNLAKVNRAVIALWSRVLQAVPGSKLLLKSSFTSDEWAHDRFRLAFAAHGVGPERLDFRTRTPQHADHLSIYAEVDIALDPFPYNGTMTTLEGLSMGVPLLALAGDSHVSRVSASLLTRVGHPEWIAVDQDDYVAKAVAFSADRGRLAATRARLREECLSSNLSDPIGLTRAVETAYRDMWRRWCALT